MNDPQDKHSINWIRILIFFAMLLLFLILNLIMTAPYFLAIIMGGMLAILFFPLYKKLRSWHWKKTWAAAMVTLIIALTIIVPMALFTGAAIDQAGGIVQKISNNNSFSLEKLIHKFSYWKPVEHLVGDRINLRNQFNIAAQNIAQLASGTILKIIESLPDYILQVLLTILSCFFLLLDGRRFLTWVNHKIPLDWDIRTKLYESFKNTTIAVIWATIAAAAVQAVLMCLVYLLLGIPGAALAGMATFIMAWIPVLGIAPAWLVGSVYLYINNEYTSLAAILVLGSIIGLADNYIRAWVLKGREEMHPLISLIAVFGGIAMYGIIGVFIGPVLMAILLLLLEVWPLVGKRYGLKFESEMEIVTETK